MVLTLVTASAAVTSEEGKLLLDAETVSMVVGLVIPLAVGLLTKVSAASGLKALVNALLSALTGVLVAFAETGIAEADLRTVITAIASTWVVSVATYYGVWKPTGVSDTVNVKTGRFGVGSPPTAQTEEKGMAA